MNLSEKIRRKTIASLQDRWARWRIHQLGAWKKFWVPQKYRNLWRLYQNIRWRKPSVVLEFGIGYSTIVMAEAIRRNGFGQIITVDAGEKWIDEFRKRVPDELLPFIRIHYSPVERIVVNGEECHRYTNVPDVAPQLVYLDGPGAKEIPGWGDGRGQLAADLLFMEDRLNNGTRIIVDGRLENCAFLDRYLKRNHRKRFDDIFKVTIYDFTS